jgi:hypothetical protein
VNHESFDEPKQTASGMDTGQWHGYYEAFWSNLLLRLKERLLRVHAQASLPAGAGVGTVAVDEQDQTGSTSRNGHLFALRAALLFETGRPNDCEPPRRRWLTPLPSLNRFNYS